MMNPYFYSLQLLVTGRWNENASPYLTGCDVIAHDIERETSGDPFEPHRFTTNMLGGKPRA